MDRRLPTLSDVARRAGVSYATADRVVNARTGVSDRAAQSVRQAIDELGYVRNVAAANLSQQRLYRLAAVLPAGSNAFFRRMRDLFGASAERLLVDRIRLRVEDVEAFDPCALRDRLDALGQDGVDGIAVVGSADPEVVGTISALRAKGVPVLALVSDLPGAERDAYVGIDNTVVGRTAGRLMVLSHGGRRGRILPVVGTRTAPDHADRLAGFYEVIGGAMDIAPVIEGRDQHELVERQVAAALEADPAITGIYSAGAGNAGLIRVLEGRTGAGPRPIVILHELVAHSRRALEAGLIDIVIDQRPEEEVARVIEALRLLADRRTPAATDPIVPTIYVRENLPPDTSGADPGEVAP
ncbi:LacI family DNA-binding transcriptional regulator [Anianabacter salinae]|uniref:LacI family DNA-binding transcriptional regulator n=1 Tax=Anianabacter salinae TaxID=2851023 RepID=UPI00225E3265|nr:LacI family DNA-binding transcriptional regulator [Anianabacter salinae]MBV0911180.1 LacI family DNA-binding transcriptional regulator [Anianabacter salinae]